MSDSDNEECSNKEVNDSEYSSSESDDEEPHDAKKAVDETCSICLNDFAGQQIGVPESCNHVFCVDCILQWSKVSSSCPADRISFSSINVYKKFGGDFCKKVVIKRTNPSAEEEEDATVCEICGNGDNEDTLLLCDGCDLGFHCACITPPLDRVPSQEWFCINCRPQQTHTDINRRAIGRTRATERVRERISMNRIEHSSLSSLDEQLDAIIDRILSEDASRFYVMPRRTTSTSLTRSSSRTRSRRRKRQSTTKRKSSKRKRKRKTKKSYRKKTNNIDFSSRTDGGSTSKNTTNDHCPFPPPLSMMGTADALDESFASAVEQTVPSYKLAEQRRKLTQSALLFNKPLPSLFSNPETSKPKLTRDNPAPVPDLLGSILGGQELLLTPSSKVEIKKGGKLSLIKSTNK